MRLIQSKAQWGRILILALGFLIITTTTIWGASAISISEDGLRFALCSKKDSIKEAETCAVSKCGTNCKVAKSCKETGYGAVYQNYLNKMEKGLGISKAITSAACGQEYPGEAFGQAMSVCKFYNRKSNPSLKLNRCYEKARFFDPSDETANNESWCVFATKISGIKSFEECLNSVRYPNPEVDCPHHVKQWCRKIK